MPTLTSFIQSIIDNALQDFVRTSKIGGRTITNLRFADDIDLIAGSPEELEELTDRSTEKIKVIVTTRNKDDDNQVDMQINNQKLGDVKNFFYLGSIIDNDVSSTREVKKTNCNRNQLASKTELNVAK